MERIKPVRNPKEESPIWEEQFPLPEHRCPGSSADIILCDILWDALRQL
jgi:hypothetical protein